ncbi:uncharacterized protein LOC104852388 isoform X1 [Fukomys damarensis]|uniref:uncharacterized protein LOC104852388 isoform X1 n=1 Tax=Fukomys damarensis TaxID=885580 RepID=UPI00053F590C|nr:uncharacterized protein LOC104852388 isoform X1 [Fukomys damarensis]
MAPLVTASPAVSGGLVPVLGGVCRSLQSPYPLLSPEIQMRAPLALQDRDGDLSVDVTVLVAQQLNSTGELVVTPATQVPALQGRGLSSLSQQRAAGLRVATPPLPPGPLAQHRVCYSQGNCALTMLDETGTHCSPLHVSWGPGVDERVRPTPPGFPLPLCCHRVTSSALLLGGHTTSGPGPGTYKLLSGGESEHTGRLAPGRPCCVCASQSPQHCTLTRGTSLLLFG